MTTHELAKKLLDLPKDLNVFLTEDGEPTSEIIVRFETWGVYLEPAKSCHVEESFTVD